MSNVLLRAWSRLWLLVALGDQISVARFGATIRCLSAASLSSGDDNPPQPYRKEVSEDSKGRCEVRESPTGSPANTERCSEQRPFSIHPEDHGLKHSWGPHSVIHAGQHTKGRQVSTILAPLTHVHL